jgi:hypothetical protein
MRVLFFGSLAVLVIGDLGFVAYAALAWTLVWLGGPHMETYP